MTNQLKLFTTVGLIQLGLWPYRTNYSSWADSDCFYCALEILCPKIQ